MVNVMIIKKVDGRRYGYLKGGFASKEEGLRYAQSQITSGFYASINTNGKTSITLKCGWRGLK